jgi:hypothetical protein
MTLLVVLSLALCIGSSTAVFSIIDAVILRKLAVSKPEQLVFVRAAVPGDPSTSSSSGLYDVVRANHPGLRGVVAQSGTLVTGTVAGQARLMRANFVSGDYFPLLGVKIFRGRMLSPFDDTPSAMAAAVISHALWPAVRTVSVCHLTAVIGPSRDAFERPTGGRHEAYLAAAMGVSGQFTPMGKPSWHPLH